jgi:hypothetical protein
MFRGLVLTLLTVVWTVILVLVGARFLALLAGANRSSDLVDILYDYSGFWVEPFFNMVSLSNEAVESGGTFEPASLNRVRGLLHRRPNHRRSP